ncbi:hypothetical protein CYMTET_56208 [Cymbomonas tetramitiformis]|uniref:AB hydrolase-1 domain-containing protein n=1 Tax=Cymbomonas tetramitiformis TaxID=36881 RepID=A0AAE0BBR8_9CHLO|nr:hypothetical protein CYMTET_56208 [Cymbomonas tetramitiformis]
MEVVGRPCYLLGNSIGGYLALAAATACSSTFFRGVHLINPAGRMLTSEEYTQEVEELGGSVKRRTKSGVIDLSEPYKPFPACLLHVFGKLILTVARPFIGLLCRGVYPVNPDAVDKRMTTNIIRDANDPRAIGVLVSGVAWDLSPNPPASDFAFWANTVLPYSCRFHTFHQRPNCECSMKEKHVVGTL